MKLLLSKFQRRMTDKHVADIIRIKNYENAIDLHELAFPHKNCKSYILTYTLVCM